MANYYVWNAAVGAGTGADWTNAITSLSTAVSGKAAGDIFYVAHDHTESVGASYSIASPGTEAAPCRIYCVNRAGSVPPVEADLRTTAVITVTGTFNIALTGSISEIYGFTFNAGTGATATNINVGSTASRGWRFVNCVLKLLNTGASGRIAVGSTGANTVIFENTTVQFSAVGQSISVNGRFIWRHTASAIAGATIPTALITPINHAMVFLESLDLSALTGNVFANVAFVTFCVIKDCKLGSGAIYPTISTTYGQDIINIRSDNADTTYRFNKTNYYGDQSVETTIIRTGGASDGTTPISTKIITSTGSKFEIPFECLPIVVWNDTTGSAKTVTIEGIWGGGAVPTNKDIWIDVEYFGTSGFPLATKATSGAVSGLSTGSNIPAGSGTWGGSTTKFAMSVTFTPQEKGPFTIYVKAALASSTFYIDPKPVIT